MVDIKELFEGLVIEDYAKQQEKLLEQKAKDEDLARAYHMMSKVADGKRVLWDIMSFCGVFQLSMTGNSYTYFNEGKRQVGLYLLTMLKMGGAMEDLEKIEALKPNG